MRDSVNTFCNFFKERVLIVLFILFFFVLFSITSLLLALYGTGGVGLELATGNGRTWKPVSSVVPGPV